MNLLVGVRLANSPTASGSNEKLPKGPWMNLLVGMRLGNSSTASRSNEKLRISQSKL